MRHLRVVEGIVVGALELEGLAARFQAAFEQFRSQVEPAEDGSVKRPDGSLPVS